MITLKEWMELIDYKITEGDNYCWTCYGDNSHSLSSWNGLHDEGGWSSNVVFDTKNQTVYEVDFCDYTNNRAYRIINPEFVKMHNLEAQDRGVHPRQAWDGVNYVDLETDDDFIQKSLAIKEGKDYDTRVVVPIELEDSELFTLMKMAHERDLTLNEMVEEILWEVIKSNTGKNVVKDC